MSSTFRSVAFSQGAPAGAAIRGVAEVGVSQLGRGMGVPAGGWSDRPR